MGWVLCCQPGGPRGVVKGGFQSGRGGLSSTGSGLGVEPAAPPAPPSPGLAMPPAPAAPASALALPAVRLRTPPEPVAPPGPPPAVPLGDPPKPVVPPGPPPVPLGDPPKPLSTPDPLPPMPPGDPPEPVAPAGPPPPTPFGIPPEPAAPPVPRPAPDCPPLSLPALPPVPRFPTFMAWWQAASPPQATSTHGTRTRRRLAHRLPSRGSTSASSSEHRPLSCMVASVIPILVPRPRNSLLESRTSLHVAYLNAAPGLPWVESRLALP